MMKENLLCQRASLRSTAQHNTIKDTVAQHGSESDNTALHNTGLKGNHTKMTILSWFMTDFLVKRELSSTMSTLGIVIMVDPLSLNWKCSLFSFVFHTKPFGIKWGKVNDDRIVIFGWTTQQCAVCCIKTLYYYCTAEQKMVQSRTSYC